MPDLSIFSVSTITMLRIGHLFGLLLGVGGATLLYAYLLRKWFKPLTPEVIRTFHFLANFVSLGLSILWLTGLGFLIEYGNTDPSLLKNQKIYAKVSIVSLLTINGIFVHIFIIERLFKRGIVLAELSLFTTAMCLILAVTSGTGWYVAFLMGTIKEYNGIISISTFFYSYIIIWISAFVVAAVIVSVMNNNYRNKYLRQQQFESYNNTHYNEYTYDNFMPNGYQQQAHPGYAPHAQPYPENQYPNIRN